MRNILITIVTATITVFVVVFLTYNFVPLSWFLYLSLPQEKLLGATLTTINASDKISSLPTTLNANFNALNTGTIQVGTTSVASITTLSGLTSAASLATIGTITTGTWNASTLTVSYGGTGSTTLAIGQVLLGSSTNALGVVRGFGTSGQFLTSNGVDVPPTWQTSAVDQAINYHWTGNHNFVGSSYFSTFNASSTLVLGGTSFTLTGDGASSSVLTTNGNGLLSFSPMGWENLFSTTTEQNMSIASTTTFAARDNLMIVYQAQGMSSAGQYRVRFNHDFSANYGVRVYENYIVGDASNVEPSLILSAAGTSNGTTSPMYLVAYVNNQSGQRKFITWSGTLSSSGNFVPAVISGSGVWNNATAPITSMEFTAAGNLLAGAHIRIYGR